MDDTYYGAENSIMSLLKDQSEECDRLMFANKRQTYIEFFGLIDEE